MSLFQKKIKKNQIVQKRQKTKIYQVDQCQKKEYLSKKEEKKYRNSQNTLRK